MQNMGNAEAIQRGKRWYVTRNGDFVGRYPTEAEAIKVAEIATNSDVWPPHSGCDRIRWHSGKWEFRTCGVCCRDVDLTAVIKYRDKHTNVAKRKNEKPKIGGSSGCAKCVWRLALSGSENGQNRYHCGYSLCLGHHSRIYLHYQRTGKQSLEGFTSGAGCTEFMAGDPRAKLSLLQDNPRSVKAEAWALLARENGKEPAEMPKRGTRKTALLNRDALRLLRAVYTWAELAEMGETRIGTLSTAVKNGRINRETARKIREKTGVNIAIGENDNGGLH